MLVNEKLELFKLGIKGKKIAVLGIGRSNIPAIKYLNKLGAKISVRDKNKDSLDKIKELQKGEVEIIVGENYLSNLDKFDYILRTPGIKPFLKEIEEATKNGVKLTSEIELLLELAPCKVVGVTGSDGKTTTTTLISKFLEKAGYRVWLGGNIGKSVFAEIDNMKKEDIIVLELSSFQLMTLKKSPNISVITNISPNHLDYHRDFEEYVMAKANIFLNQNKNDILVLNEDDIEFSKKYEQVILDKKLKTTIKKFSIQSNVKTGVYLDDDKLIYIDNENTTQVCSINDIKLIGKHNIANVCAAICAVTTLVKKEDIIDVLHNFYGVEHRMEFVREIDGVKYYNDSIASSPTRTIAGLNSFNKKIILIAGGYDKHIPYDVIGKHIIDKVKLLLLVGDTSAKIKEAVLNEARNNDLDLSKILEIKEFEDLKSCVDYAKEKSQKGDMVVMSPASASFDMYKDFEERGNYFKDLVNNL